MSEQQQANIPDEVTATVETQAAPVVPEAAKVSKPVRVVEELLHNGTYLPESYDQVGYLDQARIERVTKNVRETGFQPGNNLGKSRPSKVRHFDEVVRMMLGWPEWLVKRVLMDEQQSMLARGAAAQVILYMKSDDQAVDRVLDRVEGPVKKTDVEINQGFISVNAGRTQIDADVVKSAFDAISARKSLGQK